tara:strand:- start:1081 stop:2697 length:1617 start_codon:yes stop_codon:yes gene_type:complete
LIFIEKNTQKLKPFLNFEIDKNEKDFLKLNEVYWIIILLFGYIFFDFLQQDFPNKNYLDSLHDGDYLATFKNLDEYGGFWSSAFTVHGGENIFIVLITDYFFKFSITNFKYVMLVTVLLLKFFSIFLAFQLSQLSSSNKSFKIIFFILLSLFLVDLSSYTKINYINIRDLFVFIFFIFLINFYLKKTTFLDIFFISFSTVFGFVFHYDTGVYMHLILLIVLIHLLFAKNIKIFLMLVSAVLLNWLILINFFGFKEINIMMQHFIQIVKNIDFIHGIEYPQPLFSIGDGNDGSRATKTLLFILIAGLLTLNFCFSNDKKFTQNEKILLLILYIYSVISFKNALGRSDGPHIMLSSDWIVILLFLYICHLFFEKILSKFSLNLVKLKTTIGIVLVILIIKNFDLNKIINYKNNFLLNKTNNDNTFVNEDRFEIINLISSKIRDQRCVQNFTGDLSLPYLLGKPNCTTFISPWLASGNNYENKFIGELKQKKVKYIIYSSPVFEVDNIKTSERLKLVNSFIKENYKEILSENNYILMSLVE